CPPGAAPATRSPLEMRGASGDELDRCRYDSLFESARPGGSRVQPLRGPGGGEFPARCDRIPSHLVKPRRKGIVLPARDPAPVFDAEQDADLERGVRLLQADIPILL